MHEIITGESIVENSKKAAFSIPEKIEELEELKNNTTEKEEKESIEILIEQFKELKDYKKCIANVMVSLIETIDKEIEEQVALFNNKGKNINIKAESSANNLDIEERKLASLIGIHANALAILKNTEIGKKAAQIYEEKKLSKKEISKSSPTNATIRYNEIPRNEMLKMSEEKSEQFENLMSEVYKEISGRVENIMKQVSCKV